MRVVPLRKSASGVFDAAGRATARLRPERFNEEWQIDLTSVNSTSTLTTGCSVYRNSEADTNFIEASVFNGNKDTSDSPYELAPGEELLYVWTGGTPGRVATVSVRGKVLIR
jgi:hypothetical protein